MEINQRNDAKINFCERYALARMLGDGRLKSFFVSIQTLFKNKQAVTHFFMNKLNDFAANKNFATLKNEKFCKWHEDGPDLVYRVEQRYNEMIKNPGKYNPETGTEKDALSANEDSKNGWKNLFNKGDAKNQIFDFDLICNFKAVKQTTGFHDIKTFAIELANRELGKEKVHYEKGTFTIEEKQEDDKIINLFNQTFPRSPHFPHDPDTNVWAQKTYENALFIKKVHTFRNAYLIKLGADIK